MKHTPEIHFPARSKTMQPRRRSTHNTQLVQRLYSSRVWFQTQTYLSASMWQNLAILLSSISYQQDISTHRMSHALWCFLVYTLEAVVCENLRRSAVSEILKPDHLAPTTMPGLKSQRWHFFFSPVLDASINWSPWLLTCLCTISKKILLHCSADTQLAD